MGCTCGDIRNKQSSNELGLQCDPYDYDVTIEQTKSFEHNITSRQDARKYDGDSTLSDPYDYDGEPYDYPATKKVNHDYDVEPYGYDVTSNQTKSSEHSQYKSNSIKADIHDHDIDIGLLRHSNTSSKEPITESATYTEPISESDINDMMHSVLAIKADIHDHDIDIGLLRHSNTSSKEPITESATYTEPISESDMDANEYDVLVSDMMHSVLANEYDNNKSSEHNHNINIDKLSANEDHDVEIQVIKPTKSYGHIITSRDGQLKYQNYKCANEDHDISVLQAPNDEKSLVKDSFSAVYSHSIDHILVASANVDHNIIIEKKHNQHKSTSLKLDFVKKEIFCKDIKFGQDDIKYSKQKDKVIEIMAKWGEMYSIQCRSQQEAKILHSKVLTFTYTQNAIQSDHSEQDLISSVDEETELLSNQCSISKCVYIHRVINVISTYHSMSVNMKYYQENVVKLCEETHIHLIDDFIHIVTQHNKDLENIFELMQEKGEIPNCNAINCHFSTRHHRGSNIDNDVENIKQCNGNNFVFFRDLLDEIHFYLLHNHQFRIQKDENKCYDSGSEITDDNMCDINPNYIEHNINKYSINIDMDQSKVLFTDALFNYLYANKQIPLTCLRNTWTQMMDEEYDTDAIEIDIKDKQNSNIHGFFGEFTDAHYLIAEYVRYCTVSSQSFSIGYTFFYWDFYKNLNETKQHYANRNDYFGYQPHELYIKQKWKSLKEEILYNNICTLQTAQFDESFTKATSYLQSVTVKQMKSVQYAERRLHYGIPLGCPITTERLLCIILRCDWSDLCTEFSATFRKNKPYESFLSIKKRNKEYAIWSRLIRETVEYYGSRGLGD
eukprot:205617_1